jgi:L-fucose mutarotase
MLKTKLLHPEILSVLGSNGHSAKILIADSNFPFSTCALRQQERYTLILHPEC